MLFSWVFLQNMSENGHITSNISKIIQFKNHGIAPTSPPDLPTLKAYPTPGVGGRFEMFSLKWRERMNLKVPGGILPLGWAILSTGAKTVWEVVATPLWRTRVKFKYMCMSMKWQISTLRWTTIIIYALTYLRKGQSFCVHQKQSVCFEFETKSILSVAEKCSQRCFYVTW